MRILVVDIETIRDESTWQPKEADDFPPPYGWRPIVIGCVLMETTRTARYDVRLETHQIPWPIDVAKDVSPGEWERRLLLDFAAILKHYDYPDVVTWNGRNFDIPVLMLRSMRYGIRHSWYYQEREPRYRFTELGHCDLADHMADMGGLRGGLALDGMAKLIGLPGKFGSIDGAGVGDAFAAGRHDEIAAYCVADAVQTAFLYLRWQLLKGDSTLEGYRAGAGSLLAQCEASPRLKELCALVDRKTLLLLEEQSPPRTTRITDEIGDSPNACDDLRYVEK